MSQLIALLWRVLCSTVTRVVPHDLFLSRIVIGSRTRPVELVCAKRVQRMKVRALPATTVAGYWRMSLVHALVDCVRLKVGL